MGMLLFGSLGYYLENAEEDTGFSSIPQGMWWAVQTLTSVGYGDFTTQTVLGKVENIILNVLPDFLIKFAGSFCTVCGVLVLALPIPIIVDNFAEYYESEKKIEFRTLNNEKNIREVGRFYFTHIIPKHILENFQEKASRSSFRRLGEINRKNSSWR